MVVTDRMSFVRGVAQWISAPAWGAGGRPFKSDRPDLFYSANVISPTLIKLIFVRSGPTNSKITVVAAITVNM